MPSPDSGPSPNASSTFQPARQREQLCDAFVQAWRSGSTPRIEEYLDDVPAAERGLLLLELLRKELMLRKRAGDSLSADEYASRFPNDLDAVAEAFETASERPNPESTFIAAGPREAESTDAQSVACGPVAASDRYRKLRKLGQGAFGAVWLAMDLELQRQVAMKEPRPDRLKDAAEVDAYLAEARALARLDHPGIVPVYDAGRTSTGSCYVVSKLIDGLDLAAYARRKPLSFDAAAQLVRQVAEALQHTHDRGVVHRDIKPANILIDSQGRPYVADFGLARRDEDFGQQQGRVGTLAYMSPEQARGEGHLVDGRSDIFSLGVVLYELLTGERPFRGADWQEIYAQLTTAEAEPPRQRNEAIPKELERICLKALAKRAADRYQQASELADDLLHWSAPQPPHGPSSSVVKIVPKGLRSFDATDRDFFLELLPGPRDRDGLPETLRFWKTRLEEDDPQRSFRVGLLYGPSGCGKSSLLKAGLLPRLADHLIRVFLEATPQHTETQLLQSVRQACPDLPFDLSLTDALATIRRGQGLPPGRRLVLVLDQFEQWLHARGAEQNTELAAALRQCDGQRIQALLLVRDDFWMPATRFLRELETPFIEGQNAAAADLFDLNHARKVLAEFGKAYGRLPDNLGQLSSMQQAFLNQAVSGLAEEGRVICVRLALFADMMKGRDWTPAALKEVGGTAGVGVTFLEESFSSRNAPPHHRRHQQAAREVLRSLLPDAGAEIKGHFRTARELQDRCGYSDQPHDFAELIRVLDREVRLITPATSDGPEPVYQLTHDYLVPSLRDWLTRKQRETRRGQAALRLSERAATWNVKPENRQLPSLTEYAQIVVFTARRHWDEVERRMMRRATRHHLIRVTTVMAILLSGLYSGLSIRQRVMDDQRRVREESVEKEQMARAEGLVDALVNANTTQVGDLIANDLASVWRWAEPILRDRLRSASNGSPERLHLALALVKQDDRQASYIGEQLLDASPAELLVLREALTGHDRSLAPLWWEILLRQDADPRQRRLRAAAALAKFAPADPRWSQVAPDIARQVVTVSPIFLGDWLASLRPVHKHLVAPLREIYRDYSPERRESERALATEILADYSAEQPEQLIDLLLDAEPAQFAVVFPRLKAHGARALQLLETELDRQLEPNWYDPPLHAAWPSVEGALVSRIEMADGLVADRFAICRRLPWEEFASTAEQLSVSGYRPTRVRPWLMGEKLVTAAIWKRDGRRWELETNLFAEQLSAAAASGGRNGLLPADVAVQPSTAATAPRSFVLLWSEPTEAGEQRRLLAELNEQDLLAAQAELSKLGFQSQTAIAVSQNTDPPRGYAPLITTPWKTKLFKWESAGPMKPPADWAAVIANKPLFERDLPALNLNWQRGGLTPDAPREFFALTAESEWALSGGEYRLRASFDDGVRIYFDDRLVVDRWSFNHATPLDVTILASAGKHSIRVEYFQIDGGFTLAVELTRPSIAPRLYAGIWSNKGAASELNSGYPGGHSSPLPQADLAAAAPVALPDPRDSARAQLAHIAALPAAQSNELPVRLARAVALHQLGDMEAALADLDFLTDRRLRNSIVRRYRAWTLAALGKADEARAELAEYLNGEPDASAKAFAQIVLAACLGDHDETSQQLESAVKSVAQDPSGLYRLGCAAALAAHARRQSDAEFARRMITRACELLESAVSRGFKDGRTMRTTVDLAALHGDPRFIALLERLEASRRYVAVLHNNQWRDCVLETSVVSPPREQPVSRESTSTVRETTALKTTATTATVPERSAAETTDATKTRRWSEVARQKMADGYRPVAIAAATSFDASRSPPVVNIVWHRPLASSATKLSHARRQAGAAITLLRQGEREKILKILRVTDDPEALTQFVHRVRDRGVSAEQLWDCVQLTESRRQQLEGEARRIEDRVLYGLLLALGEFPWRELPEELREPAVAQLASWYGDDPSAVIHGVAGWLLRHWEQAETASRIEDQPRPYSSDREWFSLALDIPAKQQRFIQTYVVFPAGEYEIGSPLGERYRHAEEVRHRVRITRPFAILDREITRGEFEASGIGQLVKDATIPTPQHAAATPTWYECVSFCRWLTTQFGLPESEQCYADPRTLDRTKYPLVADLTEPVPQNWPIQLARHGFRLPTESEWEIAARAMVRSVYGFGDDASLLNRYGWFQDNSGQRMHVPRELRPNLKGIFDMHGNASEWCHDWFASFESTAMKVDPTGHPTITPAGRVNRGGGWSGDHAECRSAYRGRVPASIRGYNLGLRVAFVPAIVDRIPTAPPPAPTAKPGPATP